MAGRPSGAFVAVPSTVFPAFLAPGNLPCGSDGDSCYGEKDQDVPDIHRIPVFERKRLTAKATTHAVMHWKNTINTAYFLPSSRLTAVMAATQGVYRRQKIRSVAAPRGEMASAMFSPNRTCSVETTVSFAMKPLMRAVQILQSDRPSGANRGEIQLANMARMLSRESCTMFRWVLKLCKNQMIIVAIRIRIYP